MNYLEFNGVLAIFILIYRYFPFLAGWNNSTATDLTAIDPAIVSSGQLTDSRSDSPPHWLKPMDFTGSEAVNHAQWNNLLPYNLVSGGLPSSLGIHGSVSSSYQQATPQRSNAWPPTSPPPGFSSISPLHHAKQHQPHKIES